MIMDVSKDKDKVWSCWLAPLAQHGHSLIHTCVIGLDTFIYVFQGIGENCGCPFNDTAHNPMSGAWAQGQQNRHGSAAALPQDALTKHFANGILENSSMVQGLGRHNLALC